jgi:hypothetical protein
MKHSESGLLWARLEGEKIKRIIRLMVDRSELLDFTVGLSGSTTTWMRIHEEPYEHHSALRNMKPGDVDIFVCGGRSEADGMDGFTNFVFKCLSRLKAAGYQGRALHMWDHQYIYPNEASKVASFWIDGVDTKFSFIQCRRDKDVHQVVKRFDFDVVRGVYDFEQDKVRMDGGTEANLRLGKMKIDKEVTLLLWRIEEGLDHPSKEEIWKLRATRGRMDKYRRRGFMIVDGNFWRSRMTEVIDSDWS